MSNDDHQKTMDDLFATWSKLPAEFRRRFLDKAEGHEIGAAANSRPAEKPRAKRTRKALGKNLEQATGEQT